MRVLACKSGGRCNLLHLRQLSTVDSCQDGQVSAHGDVERRFAIGEKTAKRDLSELCRVGKIVFERKTSPGYYRINAG